MTPSAEPGRTRFTITDRLPFTLHVAFWALIAEAASNLVIIGAVSIGFNAARYVSDIHTIEAQRHQPRLSDSAVLGNLIAAAVLVALLAGFQAVLAILIRRGRNWARIVTVVLLGLGVVVRIAQQPVGPAFVFSFFVSAFAVVAVWLMWMPASNRYFRAVAAARKQHRATRTRASVPVHPAAWVSDPSGRHQHRYWDGLTWTPHVADNGIAALDPL